MKNCPYCAKPNPDKAVFCNYCKQDLPVTNNTSTVSLDNSNSKNTDLADRAIQVKCPNCERPFQLPNDVNTFYCSYCGREIVANRTGGIVHLSLTNEKLDDSIELSESNPRISTKAAVNIEESPKPAEKPVTEAVKLKWHQKIGWRVLFIAVSFFYLGTYYGINYGRDRYFADAINRGIRWSLEFSVIYSIFALAFWRKVFGKKIKSGYLEGNSLLTLEIPAFIGLMVLLGAIIELLF